jgi:hypothetical protein
MTAAYLESDDIALREAAEMKLLAQANAEVEVALALLAIAGEEAEGKPGAVKRSSRAAGSQMALNELVNVLETPLANGMQPYLRAGAVRGAKAIEPEKAGEELQDQVRRSLRTISRQATKASSSGLDTLLSMDPTLLKQGVALVSKDVSDLIDSVVDGFNDLIRRLATSAIQLLLQAYDWILALLGKDAEQNARKKVHEWIEELRASHTKPGDEDDLAAKLINLIYTPDKINAEVSEWLKGTQASVETLNKTSESVSEIGAKYEAKANRVEDFFKVAGVVRSLPLPVDKIPYVQLAIVAIVLGLMGYTLYTGYDHVDSGAVNFKNRFSVRIPDRVEGVRETVQKSLNVPESG